MSSVTPQAINGKFVMFYLFPVDSILIREDDVTTKTVDRTHLCLPEDEDGVRRMLPLFQATPADDIIADLKEMGLNALACVGMDGTCLSPDEIRCERYVELIKKCQEAGILFIHSMPFADTYDNQLTTRYPHIKQKNYQGDFSYVGWHKKNGHFTIDYGCDEFIDFCKKSIDALKNFGVRMIDYGEPDHYPCWDNGFGESLVQAWREKTGRDVPCPTTVEYRRFMEDRNFRGLEDIGNYARKHGLADHLTASPLGHNPFLICQNFGKYSRTDISQLSTTYHCPFGSVLQDRLNALLDLRVTTLQLASMGCIESKSMRGWNERHGVYAGVGQGRPLEKIEEMLQTAIIAHRMDVFFWDYVNFKNQSMYDYNRFEDPKEKYQKFKQIVRSAMDTYASLPSDYKTAQVSPAVLVAYAKESDYRQQVQKDYKSLPGWLSLYSVASKLQGSDLPFMFAYDEYPEALARDGKDVPLLVIDGYQHLSKEFSEAVLEWFSKGKTILFGGELQGEMLGLVEKLSAKLVAGGDGEPIQLAEVRPAEYWTSKPSIATRQWQEFFIWDQHPLAWIKGTADSGRIVYSQVPVSRLHQADFRALCDQALERSKYPREKIVGTMTREVIKYTAGSKTFVAIQNHEHCRRSISLITANKPIAVFPRKEEFAITKEKENYRVELDFRINEVRIIETE